MLLSQPRRTNDILSQARHGVKYSGTSVVIDVIFYVGEVHSIELAYAETWQLARAQQLVELRASDFE
jgi:hypothetical protein